MTDPSVPETGVPLEPTMLKILPLSLLESWGLKHTKLKKTPVFTAQWDFYDCTYRYLPDVKEALLIHAVLDQKALLAQVAKEPLALAQMTPVNKTKQ